MPRAESEYRGTVFTEMDVDAVLARKPAVAFVDEPPARRTHQAARLRAEAETLSFLAGGVLRGETGPDALLERLRETFAMESVALPERRGDTEPWTCVAAVSHDLRTPLAGIKASASSLRSDDVEGSEEDRAELLANVEEDADRLDRLVGNLLDVSRLETGTVTGVLRQTDLDAVVPTALVGVPDDSVELDVPETLPMVVVDRGLLDRAVADVVENAVQYSPAGTPALVAASAPAGRVELRVVDRGPGVPDEAKDRIFGAFQRYGDAPRGAGVGFGLAVARGFVEAMGGTVTAEDTPGGDLTMTVSLRMEDDAPPSTAPTPRPRRRDRRTGHTERHVRAWSVAAPGPVGPDAVDQEASAGPGRSGTAPSDASDLDAGVASRCRAARSGLRRDGSGSAGRSSGSPSPWSVRSRHRCTSSASAQRQEARLGSWVLRTRTATCSPSALVTTSSSKAGARSCGTHRAGRNQPLWNLPQREPVSGQDRPLLAVRFRIRRCRTPPRTIIARGGTMGCQGTSSALVHGARSMIFDETSPVTQRGVLPAVQDGPGGPSPRRSDRS
ncbi:hypothetical protein GCM10010275_43230 [Streptomyces litmocidini]|nr:hypothetical protein GCM10010275_43230 [Streptomyces litmocidini]